MIFLFVAITMFSCREKKRVVVLTIDSFSELRIDDYMIQTEKVRKIISQLVSADTNTFSSEIYFKKYYLNNNPYLWITRAGVSSKADSVLKYIERANEIGLNPERFRYYRIKQDLSRLRKLDFDEKDNNINNVLARLEYNLTKAYSLYCAGLRYGFVNPAHVLNRLDVDKNDTIHVNYHRLFDIAMQHPGRRFYSSVIDKIRNDSTIVFMRESYPTNKIYGTFALYLQRPLSRAARKKVLINMERCRWHLNDYPFLYKKYVWVNVASQSLEAYDGDDVLSMRIGCGATATKTPLLTSQIKRLDFNPKWIIPRSILRTDISRHVGDIDYFKRNNYYVLNRKTGETIDVSDLTHDMLKNPDILVLQQGGAGNSLGSVIFRFDNNFSIYLHDTSNRNVFSRSNRCVSHGCIRVEKPLDLALFLLSDKDEDTVEKIKYTMEQYSNKDVFVSDKNKDAEKPKLDKKRYIKHLKLESVVPVFITYYTLYPDKNGAMRDYGDIYGYDPVIYDHLSRFM